MAIFVTALMFLVKMLLGEKFTRNQKLFEMGVDVAYNIVNDLAKRTPNQVDDKVALGLKALQDWFKANGQTLSAAQAAKAKLLFQAMNGAGK
jgi:hypothetical protein